MITVLLLLSLLAFIASLFVLTRKSPIAAPVTFSFLAYLHGIVGVGFLFRGMYRHWNWGDRYNFQSWEELTITSYVYVFIICLTLLGFSYIRMRSIRLQTIQLSIQYPNVSRYEISFVAVLCLIYITAVLFGTLRLDVTTTLPFRLNGILEVTVLVILPFYVVIRFINVRHGFWIALLIIALYGLYNITTFGTKGSAVGPLAVLYGVMFIGPRISPAKLIVPLLLAFSLYAVFNPYTFQDSIQDDPDTSRLDLISEALNGGWLFREDSKTQGLLRTARNFSYRTTSILPMQVAINENPSSEFRIRSGVIEHYNRELLKIPAYSTEALGHFGFFMFAVGNHILGFSIGLGVLGIYFLGCLLAERMMGHYGYRPLYAGLLFVIMLLPGLLDGNYHNISHYLQLLFVVLVAVIAFPSLFSAKNLPPDTVPLMKLIRVR